jgi:Fe2+ or Zn2+ uptake regulation protein/Fe2+ transport system protein FeoA
MSFLDKASEAIRTAGGRMTDQRQTIIELLAEASGRVDAETLHQLVLARDPQINLATIYRTLDVLESAQLIRAQFISADHSRKYFTLALEPYHFTCRRCHRVIAFASDLVEMMKLRLQTELHVQTFNACVCVEGLCPDCQAQEDEERKMARTLDQLLVGSTARVRRVGGRGIVRRRLMDMGLVRGVEIEFIKAAPMGDPLEFRVLDFHLSLRKTEAQLVEIEPL